MITTTHVSLDQAILQLQHWFHQRPDPDKELANSIADAEGKQPGIKAASLLSRHALTGGGKIDALFILWCAVGAIEVVEIDNEGQAKTPIAWRGLAMVDHIERAGLDKLYTPHFDIEAGNQDDPEHAPQPTVIATDQESRFDPLALKRIRSELCKSEKSRKWFDNAANRPAPWVKSARVGRNRYDPQQIADGFVSNGQLDQGAANRILKRLLPDRSRHLEDFYE